MQRQELAQLMHASNTWLDDAELRKIAASKLDPASHQHELQQHQQQRLSIFGAVDTHPSTSIFSHTNVPSASPNKRPASASPVQKKRPTMQMLPPTSSPPPPAPSLWKPPATAEWVAPAFYTPETFVVAPAPSDYPINQYDRKYDPSAVVAPPESPRRSPRFVSSDVAAPRAHAAPPADNSEFAVSQVYIMCDVVPLSTVRALMRIRSCPLPSDVLLHCESVQRAMARD
jgi:hypothetical protein